jgi:general secretion pathway protein G
MKGLFMNHTKEGFTLIEIVVALAIVALVAGISFGAFSALKRSRIKTTKELLNNIVQVIGEYTSDTRNYPKTLDDLMRKPANVEGWTGPYVEKERGLQDVWGNRFESRFLGKGQKPPYELFSWGPDGVGSTTGQISADAESL